MTSTRAAPSSPSRTVGSLKNHLPGQQGLTFCFPIVCSITRINKHSLALGLPFTFPVPWLCHNLFKSHPRTPGDACVMAGPWHSPCPRRYQELLGSRTRTWSGCWHRRRTNEKRVWVQFRLSWSTLLAGISGELLPLGLAQGQQLLLECPQGTRKPWVSTSSCAQGDGYSIHLAPCMCTGNRREIPWDELMSLQPSHRLVEKNPNPNPSTENISLSRLHLHGWEEDQGDTDGHGIRRGLIVVVRLNPIVAQVHSECRSIPAPRVPAVPSLLPTIVSTGRFGPRAVIVCWE